MFKWFRQNQEWVLFICLTDSLKTFRLEGSVTFDLGSFSCVAWLAVVWTKMHLALRCEVISTLGGYALNSACCWTEFTQTWSYLPVRNLSTPVSLLKQSKAQRAFWELLGHSFLSEELPRCLESCDITWAGFSQSAVTQDHNVLQGWIIFIRTNISCKLIMRLPLMMAMKKAWNLVIFLWDFLFIKQNQKK